MKPYINVLVPFVLVACSSLGSGGADGAPADDGGSDCVNQTPTLPTTCYESDCKTVLGSASCTNGVLRCPSGYSYFQCYVADCPPAPQRYCQDADGGLVVAGCNAGITICPPGTTLPGQAIDGGPDAMTSDGGDGGGADGGITTCNGEAPCYSLDCTRIVMCDDTGFCQIGTLNWNQCFGPDAGRDGPTDR
jgi:hypothetical protein